MSVACPISLESIVKKDATCVVVTCCLCDALSFVSFIVNKNLKILQFARKSFNFFL